MKAHLLAVLLSVGVLGALGCPHAPLRETTTVLTRSADTAYGLAVEICDSREKAIIEREGTTEQQDLADLAKVRQACDHAFAVFEAVRTRELELHEAARALEALQ